MSLDTCPHRWRGQPHPWHRCTQPLAAHTIHRCRCGAVDPGPDWERFGLEDTGATATRVTPG